MHKSGKSLLILLFALAQVVTGSRGVLAHDTGLTHLHEDVSSVQLAQYQYERDRQSSVNGPDSGIRIDVEPPLIEHDVIAEVEADIRQSFVATVVDDEELDSVLFYYRYAGESSFSRYVMMPVSFSSTYIAQIPTDPNSYTPIEYYIQARDFSGNRTVRGYAFSPLVRNIVPPLAVATADVTLDTVERTSTSVTRKLPKAVYIVGGVLLVGLIASAAGSSGGDSGGGGTGCGADGCRLSLTLNPPF